MIKPIVKDMLFLGQKSEPATKEDLYIAQDLRDTLAAHKDRCVGMAANMIGYKKCIIIVSTGFMDMILINPQIIGSKGKYETEEGCGRKEVLVLKKYLIFAGVNGAGKRTG